MISVEVTYYNKGKKKNNDLFVYTSFVVEGHANNGTSLDCTRVCAGVSACVIGIRRLLDTNTYEVQYKNGFFKARLRATALNEKYVEIDSTYALNTLLCQLYDLNLMYPSQFSKFDMFEIKEKDVNVRKQTNKKPKPFRKRKSLGIRSSYEETSSEED